jgi:hypothetical protein
MGYTTYLRHFWAERIFQRFEHSSLQIEVSQIIVHKAHQPDIVAHFFDADGLAEAENKGAKGLTYLYDKVGANGGHLKYRITESPLTLYTLKQLGGGRLKLLASGAREEMLTLERALHETLPIGPEEQQGFYILKQVLKGLRAPPY